ncbi:MAG TPA: YhjD/YihY/BrkB family envelope integrity protein [Solirubrobacteraceae bacterium]|nr:YhjD/YihY/BrkB family envelope integrity protein [Solirubrobacteraceae bacterium]
MSTTPQTTQDWEGQTLLDRAGEKIGTIDEIYLVEDTGQPEWALVKMGRIGRRAKLVPLSGASPSKDGIRARCPKSAVSDAPAIDAKEGPSDEEVTAIYRHYGIAIAAAPDTSTGGSAGQQREQPVQRDRPAQREQSTQRSAPARPQRDAQAPSTGSALKRTFKEFSDDNLTHWAAALTYYGVLSIFPALLALVSILGLIGSSATQPLLDNVAGAAPGPAKEILEGALRGLQEGGGSGLLFFVALAGAIWAASGYISAFMDASNAVYDVEEGRSIFLKIPLRIAVTVLMVVLLAAGATAVVLTGPIAEEAGKLFGVGDTALSVWDIAKWPVLVLIASFMFAVLYYTTPNVKQPGVGSVLPGGALAVGLWIVVSALFALYVANFSSYDKTYGALGGVIVFLVWLWLTNLAILLGAEFNAERARGRHMAAGHPASDEPYLQPRARA